MKKRTNQPLRDTFELFFQDAKRYDSTHATIKAKKNECVIPLCISICVGAETHGDVNTSKSGIVFATAPQNIASRPIFFPKTASPSAAPKTKCVKESTAYCLILFFSSIHLDIYLVLL